MNRYPAWKFAIIVIALCLGVIYTLPNFFGEAPAVQVSSAKVTAKVDAATLARVEEAVKAAGVPLVAITWERAAIKARVAKLRAAGIQPTLKRVVFLQKTLSKYRPLLEPSERNGSLQAVSPDTAPDPLKRGEPSRPDCL